VGGPSDQRGVIAAASYRAREFGVRSAMSTAEARRLCPDLVLLPPDFDRYTAVSREIMSVFRQYTPLVEPLSLDEAFLDVSGSERLFGEAPAIGRAIKKEILRRTGLVASVGVAPSKFLAKLASDLSKPDGFQVIEASEVRALLDPLPVSKVYGVGARTALRLESMGVRTIGDLARRDKAEVAREFGATAVWIHDLAHGIDARARDPARARRSRTAWSAPSRRTSPTARSCAGAALLLRGGRLRPARQGPARAHGHAESALRRLHHRDAHEGRSAIRPT
jgi:DNA polymerase-4